MERGKKMEGISGEAVDTSRKREVTLKNPEGTRGLNGWGYALEERKHWLSVKWL